MATKGELELRVAEAQVAYQQAKVEHERMKDELAEVEATGDLKAIRLAKKEVDAARNVAVAKLAAVEEAKAELATGIERIRRESELERVYDEAPVIVQAAGAAIVGTPGAPDVLTAITNELKALRSELSAARLGTVNPPAKSAEEQASIGGDQPQRGYLAKLWDATF